MYEAPFPPYDPTDKSSFAYETVLKRWPAILTNIVNEVYRVNHTLTFQLRSVVSKVKQAQERPSQLDEGKNIIAQISRLKYRMLRDMEIEVLPDDGKAGVQIYNGELARLAASGKNTWFKAPWLFSECYLYRLVRCFFSLTEFWHDFDPFLNQKTDTLRQSWDSIYGIATILCNLESMKASDTDKLGELFKDMLQICLWGNATDLSLLTNLSYSDVARLQSIGIEKQEARKSFILRDDQEAAWRYLKGMNHARVDFVVDNAGYELFTDLVLADFLVSWTPYVDKVVFHPKLIPWFVSDATPLDFTTTISSLLDVTFFQSPPPSASAAAHLSVLANRLHKHFSNGTFALSVDPAIRLGEADENASFWVEPWPFWDMQTRARKIWESLHESALVIFKGDLNYRKLTGDVKWPASTPFATALGPLAGSFPILSLRTAKADVVVGIDQDVEEKLDQSGEKWRVNGRYALISFLDRIE